MDVNPLDINTLKEYLKIHLISLQQDLEKIDYVNGHHFYRVKEAEIDTVLHILGVINEREVPLHPRIFS